VTSASEPVFSTEHVSFCDMLQHGAEIGAHFHDYGQLRYAASGALVTATEVGTWVAPANRITWVPPFSVHSGSSYGETDVRLLRVPADLAERLPSQPSVFVASPLVREAYLATTEGDEEAAGARARLLLEVVVTELASAHEESLRLPEPSDKRLKAVTDLLHADPASHATLAELGHQTGSSQRTLSRLFSSELSMSFHQWRTLLRVQRSVLELCQGASVTDTAVRLGWANPSSFIDAFTELVGQTPGRFRSAVQDTGPDHRGGFSVNPG
jgi:AraC-like DNA-binding protein